MSGKVLKGPRESEVDKIYPDVSYGKIILDILTKCTDSIALIDALSKQQISFKQILEQSIKVAIAFKEMGIEKNDVIGIVSENCVQYFVPILASLYIGAVVHPVNIGFTIRELKYVFDISKPKIIFASNLTIKAILELKVEVDYINQIISFDKNSVHGIINLEDLIQMNSNTANFDPCEINTKEDVAFILCSAGTTGLPKCVMLTHANLTIASTYLVDSTTTNFSIASTLINVLPFFHVFGLLSTIGGLLTGMKIIILKFSPDLFLKTIEEYKVTNLVIVPPMAIFLSKSPLVDNYNLSSIKDIICGAAPLGSELENILKKKFNVIVRQAYGLTEATALITCMPIGNFSKPGSVGKLVYGTIVKIRDLQSNVGLEANKIGEICTKSGMNMKGYLGNEKETKALFDNEGFLRTGDIGYYDEDGFIYIIDRLKELIKYKGFQVAPAELEDLLTNHEDIFDAGVIGVPDDRAGEVAMAFVVTKPGSLIAESKIINYIAENVSIQKQLHGGVQFIDAIPKSASGKILRKTLRELAIQKC